MPPCSIPEVERVPSAESFGSNKGEVFDASPITTDRRSHSTGEPSMMYPVFIVVGRVPWWLPLLALVMPLLILLLEAAGEAASHLVSEIRAVLSKWQSRRRPRRLARKGLGYWIGYGIGLMGHRAIGLQWADLDDASVLARRSRKSLGYRACLSIARWLHAARRAPAS